MSIQIRNFGKATDGTSVKEGILSNGQLEVHILSYAALIHRLIVPDRHGRKVDVVLGYPTVEDYELNPDSMGAVVGRYANRIGGASFYLYTEEYHVTANENGNCLHSGLHGFHHTVFRMVEDGDALVLTAVSPDGTDGFPGNVELEVRYSLAGSGLVIQYTASTDAPTVINITNHSYFNLNGHDSGSVLGHRLSMDARTYLETDEYSIPTGRKIPVAGTPMDFTEEKTIGRDIAANYPALVQCRGYDHCYVVPDTGLRHVAWLTGPDTGIRMETLTTQPGVQVYTANYLEPKTPGKDGARYAPRHAVCLETQEFPDSPNHNEFPDVTVLPETPYSATTVYRFDVAPL
ncbi:MAG: aldose epimerase family protein [Gemmiger sp.]|uniref:aldose epimerase family protein n=1 Tax=Gemmiger sp. TaxID=2049027 RepID=UPI002E7A1EB9|nr:aldose epimerase family protein [Gemmiger sp.]MEE0799686.1 aldose epimerase family protein [Gemmiger sp.]